jgi:hypothetical protein
VVIGCPVCAAQFIGVLFENFKRMKKQLDMFALLTDSQREWVIAQRRLRHRKPVRAIKVRCVLTTGSYVP